MDCTGFHTLYLPSTALVYSLMPARANIPLEISEPEIEGISTDHCETNVTLVLRQIRSRYNDGFIHKPTGKCYV